MGGFEFLFCFFLVVDGHSALTRLGVSFPLLIASCISSLSRSCPAVASSSTNPPEGGASPTGGRTVFDGGSSAGELHCWTAAEPSVPEYASFLGSYGVEDTSSLFDDWGSALFPTGGAPFDVFRGFLFSSLKGLSQSFFLVVCLDVVEVRSRICDS